MWNTCRLGVNFDSIVSGKLLLCSVRFRHGNFETTVKQYKRYNEAIGNTQLSLVFFSPLLVDNLFTVIKFLDDESVSSVPVRMIKLGEATQPELLSIYPVQWTNRKNIPPKLWQLLHLLIQLLQCGHVIETMRDT